MMSSKDGLNPNRTFRRMPPISIGGGGHFGKELEKIENNFDKLKREAEELLNEINSGVSEYGYGSRN